MYQEGGVCPTYHLGPLRSKAYSILLQNPITPQTVWLFISVSCGSLMAQLSYSLHSCLLIGSVEAVHGMALRTP